MSATDIEVVLYDQTYLGDSLRIIHGDVDDDSVYVEVKQGDSQSDVVLTAEQARLAAKALKKAAKRIEGKL